MRSHAHVRRFRLSILSSCVLLSILAGEEPLHREGYRGGTWVLLDYGCVVVHIFNDEARKFYSLEHLWADGEEVDLSAILPHAEEK